MHIVFVHVHVKPEFIEHFRIASIENAKNSIQEPGVARFDVVQSTDDPSRFILIEVYRTVDDAGKHKDTFHYAKWRDTVAEMMAEPRIGVKFINVFPEDSGW
jgi:quinol monooxygenase YgiN